MDVIYSKKFEDVLNQSIEKYNNKYSYYHPDINLDIDVSYIDVVRLDDSYVITFLSRGDTLKFQNKQINIDPWNNKRRQSMSFNRFFTRYLRGIVHLEKISSELSRIMKSILFEYELDIRIVEGRSIKKYYHENNIIKKGSLGNSCMRYSKCQKYLNLYTKNPEKIKMLVAFDDKNKNKIIGRALLWELIDGKIFMDRIYYSYEHIYELFNNYAEKNNFATSLYRDRGGWLKGVIQLKPRKYLYYPYLDTFEYYQPDTGLISNGYGHGYDMQPNNGDIYILRDTNGRCTLVEKQPESHKKSVLSRIKKFFEF